MRFMTPPPRRKLPLSPRGEKKQAFYVLRDFYREKENQAAQ